MTHTSVSKFFSSSRKLPAPPNKAGESHIPAISPELQATLQRIVDDVVTGLGCVGAMVATLDGNSMLPVRAYSVSIAAGVLKQLEDRVGVSLIGPQSVAYLDDSTYKDNLSVRAVRGVKGRPEPFIVSNNLHDLFRPVVNKPLSDIAQRMTGIKQVIAVPFFIGEEVVGNLFAAAQAKFSQRDIKFLMAFGHQAATAILSQRRLDETQALERVILALQSSLTDETQILQIVVDAVVEKLGYVGAMVATLEPDDTLPIRAHRVHMTAEELRKIEQRLGIPMIGDETKALLQSPEFHDNMAVRAVKGSNGKPNIIVSDHLEDLFTPIITERLARVIQRFTRVKQIIAVPFFIEQEVVGTLFVFTRRSHFTERDVEILTTFGQQAAAGIRNARLYQQRQELLQRSEERRQVAEVFAKMAFSSAANVHALRNHIGSFRIYTQLVMQQLENEVYRDMSLDILARLNTAADILDSLHEPWRHRPDEFIRIGTCINRAIEKIVPDLDKLRDTEGITLTLSLAGNLPPIKTSSDMLTEAFRVIIKNGIEAIRQKARKSDNEGRLDIESYPSADGTHAVITITDNGPGIPHENLDKIFELGWSTKDWGMGFGLFWTKDFIQGLKGTIHVKSVVDEGTTFTFSLPISGE